jgi:hypothetical protein
MAEVTTPLPTAKAFGEDERAVLLGYLAYHPRRLGEEGGGTE